ncbi:MAG TPA: hypothetical protein VFG68_10200 [Fimbriiglobus sp.]|nr:hypothetical protein [Fimbriiglobus sp.]
MFVPILLTQAAFVLTTSGPEVSPALARSARMERIKERIKNLPHPEQLRREVWGVQIEWNERMLAKFRAQRKELEARKDVDYSRNIAVLKEIEARYEKDLDWLRRQRGW